MMSAFSAFWLTSRPHVGPTVVMLTSFTAAPAYFASAVATDCTWLGGSFATVTVTARPLTFTWGLVSALPLSALLTPSTVGVTPVFVVNVNDPDVPWGT